MVTTLRKMLSSQFEAFSGDSTLPDDNTKVNDELDMLERGISSLHNPKLLEASRYTSQRHGLEQHFIRREASTKTYVLYRQIERQRVNSGKREKPKKTQKQMLENSIEVMRARYKSDVKEFWFFNAKVPMELLDDESNAFAKLLWNPF